MLDRNFQNVSSCTLTASQPRKGNRGLACRHCRSVAAATSILYTGGMNHVNPYLAFL